MDHFHVALGGNGLMRMNLGTRVIIYTQPWTVPRYCVKWPRDITLRRNMATSEWADLTTILSANDATVHTTSSTGSCPAARMTSRRAITRSCSNSSGTCPKRSKCGAAVSWAVGIEPVGNMELILQDLSAIELPP